MNSIANKAHLQRLIEKGVIEARCAYKFTDDYAFDASNDNGKTNWIPAAYTNERTGLESRDLVTFDKYDFEFAKLRKRDNGTWAFRIHSNEVWEVRFK